MRLKHLGLALTGLALVVPATASARPKAAAAADPAKVLVVTSTQDALSAAGIAAIQAGAASGNYTVTAPAPADVGRAVHARRARHLPRRRVPEHGHREPADRRAARELRGVLQEGRRLRRHRLGRRDRLVLGVPDRHPRHARRRAAPTCSPARSRSSTASMTRPRASRSTGTAPTTSTTSRPTSAASRTCSRRSSRTRSARSRRATRSTASPAARWAPTTRSPSARTTRAAARSTPALGNTRRVASTRAWPRT